MQLTVSLTGLRDHSSVILVMLNTWLTPEIAIANVETVYTPNQLNYTY